MSRPRVKPRFGSARDAATRSGLSVRTLRRLIARGELAASRVGRRLLVDLVELDRYVRRRAVKASGTMAELTAPIVTPREAGPAGGAEPGPDDWTMPV